VRAAAWALAALAGCGYAVGPDELYAHRSVRVDIADNIDERRTHEFDLTQVLVRQLQASGVRVNQPDATTRMLVDITEVREPALVEAELDRVTVGSVAVRIRVRLVDVATGAETLSEEHIEAVPFAPDRGRTRDTARAEVFDRLARWATSKLEKDW
jgi:hypothetical protein